MKETSVQKTVNEGQESEASKVSRLRELEGRGRSGRGRPDVKYRKLK